MINDGVIRLLKTFPSVIYDDGFIRLLELKELKTCANRVGKLAWTNLGQVEVQPFEEHEPHGRTL